MNPPGGIKHVLLAVINKDAAAGAGQPQVTQLSPEPGLNPRLSDCRAQLPLPGIQGQARGPKDAGLLFLQQQLPLPRAGSLGPLGERGDTGSQADGQEENSGRGHGVGRGLAAGPAAGCLAMASWGERDMWGGGG